MGKNFKTTLIAILLISLAPLIFTILSTYNQVDEVDDTKKYYYVVLNSDIESLLDIYRKCEIFPGTGMVLKESFFSTKVLHVLKDSPAFKSGIRVGDIVKTKSKLLKKSKIGIPLKVEIVRERKKENHILAPVIIKRCAR